MMASTSTADIQVWHEGDRCLAPSPRNGTLQEVTIQKLTTTSCGKVTALVKFTDQHVDDDEQEAVFPVIKLQRPDNIQSSGGVSDHEKPFFVYTRIVPGPSESLVLSSSGVAVPYTINRYLRGYQREGIQFIYDNYALSRGCILGDDMGLGKTVQVIGFLAAVLGKTGTWEDIENNRPQFLLTSPEQIKPQKVFLIVAPLSVLYNWKDELETWGHFRSVVVHGLRKEEELARIRRGRTEIALTTYETLRLSLEQFNGINWSAVIVDEAHKIKNPNSQITVAMKGLRCRVRVGLTGTILQNNLEELWCVMDWANPHCLGSLGNFKNKFSDPIELAQKHSATKRVLAVGRGAVRALARKLSHWFLRRTKSLIKEQLPKKDDKVVYCSLTSFQEAVYQEVLDTEDVKLLLRSSEKCDCHSRRTRRECCYKANAKGVRVSNLYFTYLTILRKVANHVALLQSTGNTSKKQEQYVAAVCEKVFQKFPDFTERCKQESFEAMSDPVYSGKMKVLQRLLKHYMQRKDKVLLFSLSTKLLDVLESYCMAEGLEYSRLDGNTKSRDRLKIVKDFNSCPDINLCLVSTMAGGLGLNFVGANVVVLFDPTWNPANDLQAIDRAYRIGQCRDVTVFRLISLGTVEEVIYLRQVYKQQLQCTVVGNESARRYFEAVQGADCQKGELFGIQNLFRLQTQGTCLTRKILETGKVSTKDPCEPSNGGVISGVGASATSRGPPRRILDFSSEEDDEGGCKRKVEPANTSAPPGRLSLLQHGFSRLLQRSGVRAGSGESSQSEGEGGGSEEDGFEGTSAIGTGSKGSSTAGSGRRQTPGLTSNGGRPRDGDWDTSSGSEGQEKMKGERGDGQRERNRMPVALSEDGEDVGRVRTNIKRAKRGAEADADEDSPSSEGNSSPIAKSVVPRRHQDLFDSDESEDIDMDIERLLKPKALKRSPGQLRRRVKGMDARLASNRPVDPNMRDRHTEDIETFTSSDENHMPVKRGRSLLTPQTDTLTRLKSQKANRTIPSAKERLGGTIDTFLGGVQEVAYTHSNQHVVGGSKAEERLSRAALRDVFELHKYSQFPANELVGTQETQPELSPPPQTSHGRVQAEREAAQNPRVDHPVTHASKSVHRPSRHTTVIIGETPGAIRRKQLENMACTFGSGSLRQFAEGVLRSTSAQRLSQLRQFYIKQGPELASVVRDNFPEPHTAQPKPDRTASKPLSKAKLRPGSKGNQKAAIEPQTEPRTLHRAVPEPPRDIPSLEKKELGFQKARGRKKRIGECGTSSAAQRSSPDPAISPPSRGDSSSSPLCLHHQPKSKPPPSPQAGRSGLPTSHRKGEAVEKQRYTAQASPLPSSTPNPQVLLTELLGDTSILDDLLRPRSKASSDTQSRAISSRATAPSPSTKTRAPPKLQSASPMPTPAPPASSLATERSRGSRRDFWDILEEGNEERINRLTDLSEVERVCETSSVTARARGGRQEEESTSLWKKNQKFLWKK
uniref:Excision repair cross-complementation group 6-like 2 n=1 Tax=Esox lucius TaxID=8010 RepID=A0AAY5L448_ESOLU